MDHCKAHGFFGRGNGRRGEPQLEALVAVAFSRRLESLYPTGINVLAAQPVGTRRKTCGWVAKGGQRFRALGALFPLCPPLLGRRTDRRVSRSPRFLELGRSRQNAPHSR